MWFIYTMKYYLEIRKIEILPFAVRWMKLEGIMLSEISQLEKDIYFHSYMELEKLNRRLWGKGRGKIVSEREANYKRLLNTENKLRVDGGMGEKGKWVTGIEEGSCWDEHWVLYVSDESRESTAKAKSTL